MLPWTDNLRQLHWIWSLKNFYNPLLSNSIQWFGPFSEKLKCSCQGLRSRVFWGRLMKFRSSLSWFRLHSKYLRPRSPLKRHHHQIFPIGFIIIWSHIIIFNCIIIWMIYIKLWHLVTEKSENTFKYLRGPKPEIHDLTDNSKSPPKPILTHQMFSKCAVVFFWLGNKSVQHIMMISC